MEFVDFVQNKILNKRNAFNGNNIIFQYADYILQNLATLSYMSNGSKRLGGLINDVKHYFYIGQISQDEAKSHLEYFAQQIESLKAHENSKNI